MLEDWIMIIITSVYVIATIFICYFNYQSQKVSKELKLETERQFEESNRAFVIVNFELMRSGSVTLKIQNYGKRIANDINVHISDEFIKSIQKEQIRNNLTKLSNSHFSLGIGQSFYLYLGSHVELSELGKELLMVDLKYSDFRNNYEEITYIDLSQYFWSAIYDTPIERIDTQLKKIVGSMSSMDRSLKKLQEAVENIHEPK